MDPLLDQEYQDFEDYYRYHDIFHFALYAVLGWSPVIRTMMKKQRLNTVESFNMPVQIYWTKLQGFIEDRAKARIIEEGIIYEVYQRYLNCKNSEDYIYDGVVNFEEIIENILDEGMWENIQSRVTEREVSKCSKEDWVKALAIGFETFEKVTENLKIGDKNTIKININNKTMELINE